MHQPELPTCDVCCLPKSYTSAHIGLGILQIVSGLVCSISNSILLVMKSQIAAAGGAPGIWGGIIFMIAGALGIRCRDGKVRCLTIGCMVMSIISSVVVVIVLLVGGLGLYREGEGHDVPLFSMMCILGLVEFLVAIVESAYCCRLVCCRTMINATQQRYQAVTLYANSPPGQPVNVPPQYTSSFKRNTSCKSTS